MKSSHNNMQNHMMRLSQEATPPKAVNQPARPRTDVSPQPINRSAVSMKSKWICEHCTYHNDIGKCLSIGVIPPWLKRHSAVVV